MEIQKVGLDPKIQESLVLKGDLSGLDSTQKKDYYLYRCRQIGLDPAAKPFDLLTLNGKEILYANSNCTQQLCALHKLSTQITYRERIDEIYVVSVRVTGADGRVSENQGAVSIQGLTGEKFANALLKATTKAIRRSVLAHCGLGMLDETEVETINGAVKAAPIDITQTSVLLEEVKPITEDKPWKVYLPDGSIHSSWASSNNWVTGFFDLADRVTKSMKLGPAQKMSKFKELVAANEAVGNTLTGADYQEYEQIVQRIQASLSKLNNTAEAM